MSVTGDAMAETLGFRAALLASYGAGADGCAELLRHTRPSGAAHAAGRLPLSPSPSLVAWQGYADEALAAGAFAVLRRRLIQLRFPIRAGMSHDPDYLAATRRGMPAEHCAAATGLDLEDPEGLKLRMHHGMAGPVPALIAPRRLDFIALAQALAYRNEPVPIPAPVGALCIIGLINWDRIRGLWITWQDEYQDEPAATWQWWLKRLAFRRDLYQDSLILLTEGPYSGVPADVLGMQPGEWLRHSLEIRCEHECVHLWMRHVRGSLGARAHDELIADFIAIMATLGAYRADWALRFLGLPMDGPCAAETRLEYVRREPPLSEGALRVLRRMLVAAAANLERAAARGPHRGGTRDDLECLLWVLTSLSLEELAAQDACQRIQDLIPGGQGGTTP